MATDRSDVDRSAEPDETTSAVIGEQADAEPEVTGPPPDAEDSAGPARGFGWRRAGGLLLLALGALIFLFPFWYMVVGSLQAQPDPSIGGAFPSANNITLDNYAAINSRLDLLRTLLNSGVFTGGVIVFTLVLGLLAGYALAVLEFRGRGLVFGLVLLSLIVPFQLLMIPLYVMIVRTYGLADNYLGMILPFAVNATAVFIFRQFFRSILGSSSTLPGSMARASCRSCCAWPSPSPDRPS